MKILIEMSPENYDQLLGKLNQGSAFYRILKNGIVNRSESTDQRIIQIACTPAEGQMLLTTANRLYPQAASQIERGVKEARSVKT
jgi:hypothetical protein